MAYKRVVISKFGGPRVLKVRIEGNLPEPGNGEVRVRILKASASFTDVMIRKGKYPEVKQKPPFSPGYDMIGIVDKLGEDVDSIVLGTKVADLTIIGSYSEYICLKAENLVPVPKGIDDSQGVSLILSYMTAYQMLHREADVKEGESVLIHGAGGAVGLAMLQLGRLLNLKVYGTASSGKHDIIKKCGGIPIDYKNEDFVSRIRDLEQGGLSAVFDPIGGDNFKRSFELLKPGGKLVAFGFYNAVMSKGGNIALEFFKLLFWNILPNKKKTSFYIITSMRKKHPEWFKQDLIKLFELLKEGEIAPVISGHFNLDDAIDVHRKIERAEIQGKVVFDIGK